ncbi:hypothetical protein EYF80_013611 [Liparis tanakae]|uniref:Uncharacterized protein n=1 Tax=Liparis tanakae TaxID=230148 RepID=A0A4Z2IDP2_9TELE|nr:hypothetical protein EYF80_013611 [Liparis tanakae]
MDRGDARQDGISGECFFCDRVLGGGGRAPLSPPGSSLIQRSLGGVRRVLQESQSGLGRVEAGAAQFAVDAFGVPVPVVAGHADHVSGLQGNVLAVARLVGVDGDLVVGVLPSKVVDVIQGVEEGGSVRMQRLHDLVGHAAHLGHKEKTEQTHGFIFLNL